MGCYRRLRRCARAAVGHLGRRRRRHILYGAAGLAVVGGIYVGGFATGLVTLGTVGAINLPIQVVNLWISARTQVKLHPDGGEEQERRALEGELWLLERAWREAEEIADISDSLLLPEGTEDFLRDHGERRGDAR